MGHHVDHDSKAAAAHPSTSGGYDRDRGTAPSPLLPWSGHGVRGGGGGNTLPSALAADCVRAAPTHRPTVLSVVVWAVIVLAASAVALTLTPGGPLAGSLLLNSLGLRQTERSLDARVSNGVRFYYPGESIGWERCGEFDDGRPLECSRIDVPMDHFDTTATSAVAGKTFSIPLIRLRAANASALNLLLNPGGPGGSGMQFVWRRGKQLSDIVGDGFHLLSFDPRGVNGSVPVANCFSDPEAPHNPDPDLPNLRMPADGGELLARAGIHSHACAETMDEDGAYINTPQTAADMNSILDAVGQRDMAYWGFSYGTLLGQTYATMYPDRSWRVIIDGVVNQFDWYTSLFDSESLVDAENVFDGFLDECIKAGKLCSLSSVAETKEELRETILQFADIVRDDPVGVFVNASVHGLIFRSTFLGSAIFPALYKPAAWRDLAGLLAGLLRGNTTEFFLTYGLSPAFGGIGDANTFVVNNDAQAGPAHWPQDRRGLEDLLSPTWNETLFSEGMVAGAFVRAQWRVPHTHSYVPRSGVTTAHPLLILSTTYDPVCPLVSARSARAAFVGSEIVEVRGYGHCSVAVPSVCLATRVREYLYAGKLPPPLGCRFDKGHGWD
ncbi:hypothetical protein HK405_008778 [Cladochytrium tenue]|nr:hypothetical protein HK405_008778 [Cladochytrium tenue]